MQNAAPCGSGLLHIGQNTKLLLGGGAWDGPGGLPRRAGESLAIHCRSFRGAGEPTGRSIRGAD